MYSGSSTLRIPIPGTAFYRCCRNAWYQTRIYTNQCTRTPSTTLYSYIDSLRVLCLYFNTAAPVYTWYSVRTCNNEGNYTRTSTRIYEYTAVHVHQYNPQQQRSEETIKKSREKVSRLASVRSVLYFHVLFSTAVQQSNQAAENRLRRPLYPLVLRFARLPSAAGKA